MSLFQTLFETHTGENLFSILSFIDLFLSLPQPFKNKQTFTDFNSEFATAFKKKKKEQSLVNQQMRMP